MPDPEQVPVEKIAEPEKPKSFLESLIDKYEEPKFIITTMGHIYKGSFKFMRINTCDECKHCVGAGEDGAELMAVGYRNEDPDEREIWYYCRHKQYQNWPRRIGQLKETSEKVAFFCPLEDIVPEKAKMSFMWEPMEDPPLPAEDDEAQNIPDIRNYMMK